MSKRQARTKLVRPSRQGRVTIPAEFRKQLGINADSVLQLTLEEGELRIKPVPDRGMQGSPALKALYDYFAPVREEAASMSEGEINEAIDQAVAAVRRRGRDA